MKGHQHFLEAAESLHARDPDVHFLMAGDGLSDDNRELLAAAPSLAATGRLHLLGLRSDMPRVLAALDLFSLTSVSGEGFPNVVGEAMACGVPCVVTLASGDAPVIVDSTGFVVPADDATALRNVWKQWLAESPEDRKRRADAARERVTTLYTVDIMQQQYQDLYAEALSSAS